MPGSSEVDSRSVQNKAETAVANRQKDKMSKGIAAAGCDRKIASVSYLVTVENLRRAIVGKSHNANTTKLNGATRFPRILNSFQAISAIDHIPHTHTISLWSVAPSASTHHFVSLG